MTRLGSTLLALATLGGTALADTDPSLRPRAAETLSVSGSSATGGSVRGVADDTLVQPSGGELTGQLRFVMSEPMLGGAPLHFSDLALFDLAGRWSFSKRFEVSASAAFLPKQPSFTDEKPWQSAAVGLRSALGSRSAVAIGGAGGHLLDHEGMWSRASMAVEWRKPVAEIMTFELAGGADGLALRAPHAHGASLAEVSGSASVQFHDPHGWTGAWVGVSYAVPVAHQGDDPTTGAAIDPQPRLDFRVGGVLALVQDWDVFAELAVIDRGDAANAATRLPILDGGFDQHQVIFGVTRHIAPKRSGHSGDAMLVGSR